MFRLADGRGLQRVASGRVGQTRFKERRPGTRLRGCNVNFQICDLTCHHDTATDRSKQDRTHRTRWMRASSRSGGLCICTRWVPSDHVFLNLRYSRAETSDERIRVNTAGQPRKFGDPKRLIFKCKTSYLDSSRRSTKERDYGFIIFNSLQPCEWLAWPKGQSHHCYRWKVSKFRHLVLQSIDYDEEIALG